MNAKVDLRQLVVERGGPGPAPARSPGRRRQLFTRVLLPGVLLAGFAALLTSAAWDSLHPARPVTVVPVISSQADVGQPADTPLFRAAGWVEPRPTPTVVTALAEGVVEKLLVVEGQEVQEGEVVARLVAADARLALDAAEAEVKLHESELASVKVTLTAARTHLERPVHLEAELAEAAAALARADTEVERLPHLLRAAQSRRGYAKETHDAMLQALGAVPQVTLRKAKADLEEAEAALGELKAREKRLPAEVSALRDRREALAEKLRRKADEVRQAGESEAAVGTAEARLTRARSLRDAARLRLERMVIRAPAAGRVLALVARPGSRLMGMTPHGLHEASTIVTLYDPASLQVRVDVRLDDVGKVTPGQKAKVETAALPGLTLDGRVLTATSQADIQKNTLPVKVAVENPPAALKPDMLCQVTFLALPPAGRPASKGTGPSRLWVPRQLVESSGEAGRVWVADLRRGTARLAGVRQGGAAGELVEVVSGLEATDRLIVGGREGLREGERVRIVGEDETLGISRSAGKVEVMPAGHQHH